MIFTLWIYMYATCLVLGSLFYLQKAKKARQQMNSKDADAFIFKTPMSVSQKVIRKTGTDVHVTGREHLPDGAVLFVANHQGIFDILALLGYVGKPTGFIAKQEIKKLPIIRTWMELIYCVFIDRSNRRQSVRAIHQGIQNLKAGHSLVIFPEGTRSKDGNVHSFKPGSFRLGTRAKVPIVPVAIDGTYQMFEKNNRRVKPSTIHLNIGEAIYPNQYEHLRSKELAHRVQNKIEEQLEQTRRLHR
ncbi:MAG TPA: lysophospholipid acyltransferase family protein [Bacillota bacterium]